VVGVQLYGETPVSYIKIFLVPSVQHIEDRFTTFDPKHYLDTITLLVWLPSTGNVKISKTLRILL
jgi:hypothetical protein